LDEVRAAASVAKAFAGGFDAEALADGTVAESTSEAVVDEVEVFVGGRGCGRRWRVRGKSLRCGAVRRAVLG